MTDQTQFVDVYSTLNGLKQRVPREWLGDPVLGRNIRKTPSQRELDGDVALRPNAGNTVEEIDAWARDAGVNLTGAKSKDAKLVAIEDVFGPDDIQVGMVDVEPDPPVADPLAPALVAQADVPAPTQQTSGDTLSPDETPAAGDEEN